METEVRIARYDDDLGIEAYHFKGIMQKFPNHFHEHYVIGFVKSGRRFLVCKNEEYTIGAGDLVLFNPLDSHTCEQIDGKTLDWRCLNIEKDVMRRVAREIVEMGEAPVFTTTVVAKSDMVPALEDLHSSIINEIHDFDKEENFYFLIEQLISDYTRPNLKALKQGGGEIQRACDYMNSHYTEHITLADLSLVSGLDKYALLRSFTKQKGITPYQYLSTIRINHAKRLLEDGKPLVHAAMEAGFTDQSHFTRFFKTFIGLTPKMYQNIFRGGTHSHRDHY